MGKILIITIIILYLQTDPTAEVQLFSNSQTYRVVAAAQDGYVFGTCRQIVNVQKSSTHFFFLWGVRSND